MSLITQCPACATMFRVVPDQLRISEGWVRCGQCDEVFDANAHLRSQDAPPIMRAEQPTTAEEVVQPPSVPSDGPPDLACGELPAEPAYDWGAALPQDHGGDLLLPPVPTQFEVQSPHDLELRGAETASLPPEPVHASAESAAVDEWSATVYAGMEQHAEAALIAPQAAQAQGPETWAEETPPSFMLQGARASSATPWLGRKSLWAVCCVLGVSLAAQLLLQGRDRIAAASPALQPLLVDACRVLACTVSPLREIESIAIDSSAFTSVRPGVYLLQLSLRNNASVALATPGLELTLTDTQDRPVLRRVLLPGELPGKPTLSAGAEMSASLPISVASDATAEKIAGYKLFAFYP